MEDEFVWTLEDEANYFRESYLDLKAQHERYSAVALLLMDFIAEHDKLFPAEDKMKLLQSIWKIENDNQPSGK